MYKFGNRFRFYEVYEIKRKYVQCSLIIQVDTFFVQYLVLFTISENI